ncbi:urease subunit beta [Halomonas sp. JB37]|nr:urease subunit beta [Halomonas sp. JB37]
MATEPAFLSVTTGSVITANGRTYRVSHLLDAATLLAKDTDTGEVHRLSAHQLRPVTDIELGEGGVAEGKDLSEIEDEDWQVAQQRFAAIRPLLDDPFRTRAKAEQLAEEAGVHVATLYQWVKDYHEAGHISALIPAPRGRKPGTKKLDKKVEAIIEGAINDLYLSRQRYKPSDVIITVKAHCKQAGLLPPHSNTIRNRIKQISTRETMRRRGLRDKARDTFAPIRGEFPNADFPLAVVQIDHTPADVILVDEEHRLALGRPWITLAIDVFSRMVVGIAVSMEKPSAISVGLCVSNAMLPKHEYLANLGVGQEWPVWGKMRVLHADNAKEFRGKMLRRACEQYGIDLQLRPVKLPHYGGHIERYMGTAANEIHTLPGTTFSNVEQRKGYDSEKESALTLREFEQHLVEFIVGVYHRRKHSELNMPPMRKWQLGILGDSTQPGLGMPPIPTDPTRLKLDFLPLYSRTVQRYGVQLDEINYYHEVLNPWIGSKDPENQTKARSFTIRRDPRDISKVYFYDPESEIYYMVPYRNPTRPAISVWELREATRRIREEGLRHVDEDVIFETILKMRHRVEQAVTKTKQARRQMARINTTKKLAKKTESVETQAPAKSVFPAPPQTEVQSEIDIFALPIEPFDDDA